jgi:hypothetical protein
MAYSECAASRFSAPVFLGALFGGGGGESSGEEAEGHLFGLGVASKHDKDLDASIAGRSVDANGVRYEVSTQDFPRMRILIRQFDDHPRNANICWPEARCLAEWLVGEHMDGTDFEDDAGEEAASPSSPASRACAVVGRGSEGSESPSVLELRKRRFDQMLIGFRTNAAFPTSTVTAGVVHLPVSRLCPACGQRKRHKRVLELGAATGALCIFLASLGVDVDTSDMNDPVIGANIAHNFYLNGMDPAPHLAHTWGSEMETTLRPFLARHGHPDVILGSDILAYEEDFEKLAETICELMPGVRQHTWTAASECSASAATSEALCLCMYEPVMYMCWKRRHNKSLLEGGFWKLLHERGFEICTRGQKVFEIRRKMAMQENSSHPATAAPGSTTYVQFITSKTRKQKS